MDDTAVVVGAGFSAAASVPVTSKISRSFLVAPSTSRTPSPVNNSITRHLEAFWRDVFGYASGEPPSFEDHFTALDLAANSGHNLGPTYPPSKLRALRRLSIHRVFDILNNYEESPYLRNLCGFVAGSGSAILSVNWDLVVENHWAEAATHEPLNYGTRILVLARTGENFGFDGTPLIKLHGSSNWHYCDSCQRIVAGRPGTGKSALRFKTFLVPEDFRRLGEDPGGDVIRAVGTSRSGYVPECPICESELTGRVATFSYAKALDFLPFHALWAAALHHLVDKRTWLFIGYSLPASDYELRHLLKTAEMVQGPDAKPRVEVVLRCDPDAEARYRTFFGDSLIAVHQEGVEA